MPNSAGRKARGGWWRPARYAPPLAEHSRALARACPNVASDSHGARREHRLLSLSGDENAGPARCLRARLGVPPGRLFPVAQDFQRPAPGGARRLLARRIADRYRRLHPRVQPVPAVLLHPLQGARTQARQRRPRSGDLAQPGVQSRTARHRARARSPTSLGFCPSRSRAGRPEATLPLELPIRLVQLHQRMMRRGLETHQKLPRQHVAVLLIVGQRHRLWDAHPTIDVAVENGGFAGLVAHVHILEPIEVVPAHELDIGLEVRRKPLVVGKEVDVVAIADVLADLLLARGIETGGVLEIFVDVGLAFRLLAALATLSVLAALVGHRASSAHPIL